MIERWRSIPYKDYGRSESGADCWGLACIVRQDLRGDTLDPLTDLDPDSRPQKQAAYLTIIDQLVESEPAEGAVVFVFLGSACVHAGVVATVDGRPCVVDTTSATGVRITPLSRYRRVHRIKVYDTH